MQLSKPPSPRSTVHVRIQRYRKGQQKGRSRAFTVYNANVEELKAFLMKSVEKKEASNGRS